MGWAWAALFWENNAGIHRSSNSWLLHSTVGSKECNVLTMGCSLARNVFQNKLLGSRDSRVTHWVWCCNVNKLHSKFFSFLFHEIPTSCQGFHGQVSWEGIVEEFLRTHFMGNLNDVWTTTELVAFQANIGNFRNHADIFVR